MVSVPKWWPRLAVSVERSLLVASLGLAHVDNMSYTRLEVNAKRLEEW